MALALGLDVHLRLCEVLIDVEDPGDEEEVLAHRTKYIYRDAVCFAAQLHAVGFEELARSCPRLQRVRFAIWDNSFGYNSAQAKAGVAWPSAWNHISSDTSKEPSIKNMLSCC